MFRFTIRDLLWLTVVVALGVAWWVDRNSMDRALAETKEQRDALSKRLRATTTELNAWRGGSGGSGSIQLNR